MSIDFHCVKSDMVDKNIHEMRYNGICPFSPSFALHMTLICPPKNICCFFLTGQQEITSVSLLIIWLKQMMIAAQEQFECQSTFIVLNQTWFTKTIHEMLYHGIFAFAAHHHLPST